MNPGEELDALVAKKVLGLEVVTKVSRSGHKIYSVGQPDYDDYAGEMVLANPLLPYSTSIEAAWEVVEKLANDTHGGFTLDQLRFLSKLGIQGYAATFSGKTCVQSIADTAPHAICLAALKAVGYES